MNQIVWDLLESNCEQYYIDSAEKPAFLIGDGPFALSKAGFTLYVNNLCIVGSFRSREAARRRLREIIATCRKPIKVFQERRGGRVLFAESAGQCLGVQN